MNNYEYIVQASSKDWAGDKDLCMNKVDGYPAIYWTIKRIFQENLHAKVTIAAPAFDEGGELESILNEFVSENVKLFYGYDASPLDRMINVTNDLKDDNYIIRVDGMHYFFDVKKAIEMFDKAKKDSLDCYKYPDDFPVQFTSDVYKVGALRKTSQLLNSEPESDSFKVHPKFYMFYRKDEFHCSYLKDLPRYNDDYYKNCREKASDVYEAERTNVNEKTRIPAGDQLGFHYELITPYMEKDMRVLDIACGFGFGTRLLKTHVNEIVGCDLNENVINKLTKNLDKRLGLTYQCEDVTMMTFENESFDSVVSMETIEHVNEEKYLSEIFRVLKPGGLFILSTPQNSKGSIPLHIGHVKEYSLDEIVNLVSKKFKIKRVIGIKAGTIIIPDDPVGTNTVIICHKGKV